MTDTLTARIEARLAAMEAAAEAATRGPWKTFGMAGVGSPDWEVVDERRVECDGCNEPVALTGCATMADAAHIALNDPAAVLTLVAGLRDAVALHPEMLGWCQRCADETYPCRTLLAVADALGVEQ